MLCTFEKIVNKHEIDEKISPSIKLSTFDGVIYAIEKQIFKNEAIQQRIERQCKLMNEHISKVIGSKNSLMHGMFNFRIDQQNVLWLVWVSRFTVKEFQRRINIQPQLDQFGKQNESTLSMSSLISSSFKPFESSPKFELKEPSQIDNSFNQILPQDILSISNNVNELSKDILQASNKQSTQQTNDIQYSLQQQQQNFHKSKKEITSPKSHNFIRPHSSNEQQIIQFSDDDFNNSIHQKIRPISAVTIGSTVDAKLAKRLKEQQILLQIIKGNGIIKYYEDEHIIGRIKDRNIEQGSDLETNKFNSILNNLPPPQLMFVSSPFQRKKRSQNEKENQFIRQSIGRQPLSQLEDHQQFELKKLLKRRPNSATECRRKEETNSYLIYTDVKQLNRRSLQINKKELNLQQNNKLRRPYSANSMKRKHRPIIAQSNSESTQYSIQSFNNMDEKRRLTPERHYFRSQRIQKFDKEDIEKELDNILNITKDDLNESCALQFI